MEDVEGFDKERSDAVRNTRVASTLGRVMRSSLINLTVEPSGEGSGRFSTKIAAKSVLFANTSTGARIKKAPLTGSAFLVWRRERDSNPR